MLRPIDGEQRDRAEDGYMVGQREVLRLIVQKGVVVIEAADDGDEDGV